jgi:phosphoenolpyruvate synthase/pyruvate phosphate dikinase
VDDVKALAVAGAEIRSWVEEAPFQERLEQEISQAFKNLDADGAFVFKNIELLYAFSGVADEAFRRNEFGVHEVCAVLLAERTERRVGDVFHGSQQQREIAEFDISNFYHSLLQF